MVDVEFKDRTGRRRQETVNLEDISSSGACLNCEVPIAVGTPVHMKHGKGLLLGRVKYCVYREVGYFVGVEFDEGSRWNQRNFRPMHLFDPRRLMAHRPDTKA